MRKIWMALVVGLLLAQLACAQATVGLLRLENGYSGGYTLVAPIGGMVTYLVDACGREVHRWNSNYLAGLVAYLLPDGSLLRAGRLPNQTTGPVGGGVIQRIDWDDNVVWEYIYSGTDYRQHHDIRWMPNGHVLILAHNTKTQAQCLAAGRDPALLSTNGLEDEYIVEVEPIGQDSGRIVWEWHFWDHLVQEFDNSKANYGVVADHPELLNINSSTTNSIDYLHCNAVFYDAELDQIIINSRTQSEFYILDHGTTTAEAAGHTGGPRGHGGDFLYRWGNPANYHRGTVADQRLWVAHDAQVIAPGLPGAGQILIFNNGEGRPAGQFSTVDAIVPPVDSAGNYPVLAPGQAWGPTAATWSYQAPNPTDFYSQFISGAQRLPDGHTHICEGFTGRIFEIDAAGAIQWEYVVPLSSGVPMNQGQQPVSNTAFRSYRYYGSESALAGRDLTPGDRIELNPLPLPSNCQAVGAPEAAAPEVRLFPNPSQATVALHAPIGSKYVVLDALGRPMLHGVVGNEASVLDLGGVASGLYSVVVETRLQRTVLRLVRQ